MRELTFEETILVSGGLTTDATDPDYDTLIDQGYSDYGDYVSDTGATAVNLGTATQLPTVYIYGQAQQTAQQVDDVLHDVADSFANGYDSVDWGNVFAGLAVVGGTVTAIALAPAALPILSVAGVAALGTELAGLGITLVAAGK